MSKFIDKYAIWIYIILLFIILSKYKRIWFSFIIFLLIINSLKLS